LYFVVGITAFVSFNDAIAFNRFTIKDQKNALLINGAINTKNFSNPGFDRSLDADNFQALNSKDNDLFYGEMYLDNHLTIKSDLTVRLLRKHK
jgi:hypothetical protein